MFAKKLGCYPEQWETKEVLKWIRENDDSRDEIKNRVMSVIQTNDLDGHTLRQLAAEKDEIQELFPALKERLAFKSLLRKMFKDDSATTVQTTSEQTNIPVSSTAAQEQRPHPVPVNSIHNMKSFTATPCRSQTTFIGPSQTRSLPSLHNGMTVPLRLTRSGRSSEAQRLVEKRPRPPYQEIITNTPSGFITPQKQKDMAAPSAPKLQQQGNPVFRNATVSGSPSIQQNNPPIIPNRLVANSTNAVVYFNKSETTGPQAKRQAVEIVCHPVVSPSRTITSTATFPSRTFSKVSSLLPPPRDSLNGTTSTPQITSVTSLAADAVAEDQTQPGPIPQPTSPTSSTKASEDPPDPNTQVPTLPLPIFYNLIHHRPIGYPAPLPEFSDEVQRLLASCITRDQRSISIAARRRVIRECAQFYVTITMGHKLSSSDYANIGRTMIEKHPELECYGGLGMPWSSFNKNLSQSIRNLRRRLKKTNDVSLLTPGGSVGGPKFPEAGSFDPVVISDDEEDEVEELVDENEDGEDEQAIHIKEENST